MTATAFLGATVIDATGTPPQPDAAVVVQDGRIGWVGPSREVERGPDVEVVDISGKYLIPGLLDANVHLVMHHDPDVLLRYDPGCYDDLALEAAQIALRAGITTVFDTWGPLEALRRVRDRINAGEAVGSRIFCAGNIIGNDGPWSDDFLPKLGESVSAAVVDSINQHWSQGVGAELTWMSAEAVRDAVSNYIASSGIDFVKYSSSAHAAVRFLAFSPDAQRAIVEQAHAAGLTAQACTMAPEALKAAIAAGVDLLQHGNVTGKYPIPQETLDLIVERQTPCVAFINSQRYVAAITEGAVAWHGTQWGSVVAQARENSRRLIEGGAKLMLAQDGAVFGPTAKTSPFFGAYQTGVPDYPYYLGTAHLIWLKAAIELGMDPMDGLLAATRNIADGYGKSADLGTVEAGKKADLLVLDANPLQNPDNYGRIAHVVKDGTLVDRQRLPEHPVLTAAGIPPQHDPTVRQEEPHETRPAAV
jgi:imidazolonepropionase-like amidohydrolase